MGVSVPTHGQLDIPCPERRRTKPDKHLQGAASVTQDDEAIGAAPLPVASALTWRSGFGAVTVVLVGAATVRSLTPYGQRYQPHALTSFANSDGSWTVLTFALVCFSRNRTWAGAVLGAVSFVVMNEAYGVVSSRPGRRGSRRASCDHRSGSGGRWVVRCRWPWSGCGLTQAWGGSGPGRRGSIRATRVVV